MINFKKLDKAEIDMVWDRFENLFHFKPGINNNIFFPAIKTSKPKFKFSVKHCFSLDFSMTKLEAFALSLFDEITSPGERLYALDWQHECYDFDPRREMDRNEFDEWIVPVLPDGDFYIFLTKDFNNVWIGHPWEKTVTLVGENIVNHGQRMRSDFPK